MSYEDWLSRWQSGRIGFHQPSVNWALEKYAHTLLGDTPKRVLLPLCGKTLDLAWLAERGHEVVGIEFVEQALRELCSELELDLDHGPLEGTSGRVYSNETYRLLAADIFEVAPSHVGQIDAIFDRASLIALPPDERIRYAERITSYQGSGVHTLLLTIDYDESAMSGPPYSVDPEELESLFGTTHEVRALESIDALSRNPRFRERGLAHMNERVWLLTKR